MEHVSLIVGLVSCRPRALSAPYLSAWCPVSLVSGHVLQTHVIFFLAKNTDSWPQGSNQIFLRHVDDFYFQLSPIVQDYKCKL